MLFYALYHGYYLKYVSIQQSHSRATHVAIPHLLEWTPQLQLFSGPERCVIYLRAATIRGSTKNMARQVDEAFCIDSIVHGYHVYNRIWTPFWERFWLLPAMAAAIPSPSRRVFALAAVTTMDWWSWRLGTWVVRKSWNTRSLFLDFFSQLDSAPSLHLPLFCRKHFTPLVSALFIECKLVATQPNTTIPTLTAL